MSGTRDPVQLIFPGQAPVAPIPAPTQEFKDYIIQQNVALAGEIKELQAENRLLTGQVSDLGDEVDTNEQTNIKLKQFVKNFHHQSELYRAIAKNDQTYFNTFLREERDAALIKAASKGMGSKITALFGDIDGVQFITLLLILIPLFFSMLMSTILTCTVAVVYDRVHHQHNADNLEKHRIKIAALVAFKNTKKVELDQLKQTMDIVGEVIDNAC
jgi:hypothetical protein